MTADEAILENHAAAREQEKCAEAHLGAAVFNNAFEVERRKAEAYRRSHDVAEAHRAMDAEGVSNSVYGQAAREAAIRQAEARIEREVSSKCGGATGLGVGLRAQLGGMRQPAIHPRETVAEPFVQRIFTRAEVLAVLRAEQARHTPVFSANDQTGADKGRQRTLNDLLAIFERME